MGITQFTTRQIAKIQQGGVTALIRKIQLLLGTLPKLPFYILAIPSVLIIRLIKPWLLVRIGTLISSRIGHFAANTELYLCERDAGINAPNRRHIDIFHMADGLICNQQMASMWKKVLRIWPAALLWPICRVNRLISGGESHEIGQNTQQDRDVHNLLSRLPPHLQFSMEEEVRGAAGLLAMGIPTGAQFVCLTVRDSAYLAVHLSGGDFSYHNYRDSDVQNYVLAAEDLGNRGYFVIRMGAKVHSPMKSNHPKIIDYATNGMRSDFMDIYLGAKCTFCISVGTGFDAIPVIFRRPIIQVNAVPLGYCYTWGNSPILLTKHHIDMDSGCELGLSEIFSRSVGFCLQGSDYESKGVYLIENTPEEIRDVAIEMTERPAGSWQARQNDDALQRRFWAIFPTDAVDAHAGTPLHGEIRGRFGANFLRNNPEWLC